MRSRETTRFFWAVTRHGADASSSIERNSIPGGVIFNRNPQSREQAEYRPEFDPVINHLTRDYAFVLMLPNATKDKRVLLIYGIYTQGSQAAIEYLTNPERKSELRKALREAAPDRRTIPAYSQLLLTTNSRKRGPGKVVSSGRAQHPKLGHTDLGQDLFTACNAGRHQLGPSADLARGG